MADTLIREGVAYGSQPLSPVPQYWNDGVTAWETAQGINGAIRVINYNSAGETFINSAPATMQIVTSAGATNLFSGTNPASIQLTATSTVAISGTATVNFSGSGTVVVSGTSTVAVSGTVTVNFSGSGTVAVSGTATVAVSSIPVVGSANNTWSANATISAGATSTSVDLQYNYRISYFGQVTNTAALTLYLEVSQDNTNFYTAASASITAGTSSPFHYSTETAARYARLSTGGVSATITATIAGK